MAHITDFKNGRVVEKRTEEDDEDEEDADEE